MDTNAVIALVAVVIVVVAVLAWLYVRKRRTTNLRQKFGPEYERAVREQGSERKAQETLAGREKRVQSLQIRDLDPGEREPFLRRWETVQARFVDVPRRAVAEADDLVSAVMQARGYPVADFEQRAADVSVDHPHVVENYRAAHAIALHAAVGEASTEDLRKAMIHYRSLFDELVQGPGTDERSRVA